MLEYAYHLVSFSAGGAVIAVLWYIDISKEGRVQTDLLRENDELAFSNVMLTAERKRAVYNSVALRDEANRLRDENATLKAFKAKRNMSAKQRAEQTPKAKPYVASANSLQAVGV